MVKMSPKSEALAFRAWVFCRDAGWNVTCSDVADALNENVNKITGIMHRKGWLNRLSGRNSDFSSRSSLHSFDHALDGASYTDALREIKTVARMNEARE